MAGAISRTRRSRPAPRSPEQVRNRSIAFPPTPPQHASPGPTQTDARICRALADGTAHRATPKGAIRRSAIPSPPTIPRQGRALPQHRHRGKDADQQHGTKDQHSASLPSRAPRYKGWQPRPRHRAAHPSRKLTIRRPHHSRAALAAIIPNPDQSRAASPKHARPFSYGRPAAPRGWTGALNPPPPWPRTDPSRSRLTGTENHPDQVAPPARLQVGSDARPPTVLPSRPRHCAHRAASDRPCPPGHGTPDDPRRVRNP